MSLGNRIGASSGSSSFGPAALGGPQRGVLLLGSCVFTPVGPVAHAAATLRGRVGLGGEDLGVRCVDGGVYPAACFTEEGEQRMGDGFLSTLVSEGGMREISSIVGCIMANRGQWGESDDLTKQLLTEILLSVNDDQPIAFDRSSREEIDLIFKLLDYLGLDQRQQELEGSLPPMTLEDTPHTVFSLHRSEAELAPVLTDFRALKCLIIQGPVSQNFLDSLPPTLLRLDLLSCDMTNRILMRKEVALAAVAQDGRALEYASVGLRADKEVVMAAVAQSGGALVYASAALKADREVVLSAVAQNGAALEYASVGLRGDKEVVMAAVAQNGWAQDGRALEYASIGLKGDKEVVMVAVAQNGWALEYASDGLKGDKEVVLVAVARDGRALFFASAELKGDKDVVIAAAAQDGWALEYASDGLKGDKEVVLVAVARNGWALEYASAGLRVDPDVVIVARGARVHPFTGW